MEVKSTKKQLDAEGVALGVAAIEAVDNLANHLLSKRIKADGSVRSIDIIESNVNAINYVFMRLTDLLTTTYERVHKKNAEGFKRLFHKTLMLAIAETVKRG
jgi:hypothetical protein